MRAGVGRLDVNGDRRSEDNRTKEGYAKPRCATQHASATLRLRRDRETRDSLRSAPCVVLLCAKEKEKRRKGEREERIRKGEEEGDTALVLCCSELCCYTASQPLLLGSGALWRGASTPRRPLGLGSLASRLPLRPGTLAPRHFTRPPGDPSILMTEKARHPCVRHFLPVVLGGQSHQVCTLV